MSGFIVRCVNDVVIPMSNAQNESEIAHQLRELESVYKNMDQKLAEIVEKREQLMKNDAESNPDLEQRIIQYLKVMGESNEFFIAKDLNANIEKVYKTLCKLKEDNIAILSGELNWKLK